MTTFPSNASECPHCGAGGFIDDYCWDCGYDHELQNLIDNEITDQPHYEDDIYE